jgi:protein-L-isoaspartate(D-aspartate) O-methyltransferase
MGSEPLGEVAGLGHGGKPFADLADAADFARATDQHHCKARGQQSDDNQGGDQHVIVRTGHVPGALGTRRRPFPSEFVFLIKRERSITEPLAVTFQIHHNHPAVSACRSMTKSLTFAPESATPMIDVNSARRQMIEQQVRAWDVLDLAVLEAMTRVPREEFAPAPYRNLAFADMNVPLGHGQHMLSPKLEGRILQALEIQPGDRVLEIGTGSGYFAACLGALAQTVHSVEIHADLADAARVSLLRTRALNVTVETADAFTRTDAEVYDVIALTGALPVYDPRFERMLAEGGRLFAVVGERPVMEARRITRTGPDDWLREGLFETSIEPLLHAAEPPRFVF